MHMGMGVARAVFDQLSDNAHKIKKLEKFVERCHELVEKCPDNLLNHQLMVALQELQK